MDEAIVKVLIALAGTLTGGGGFWGFGKYMLSRRSEAQKRLIEHEQHNDDIALDVAEGLRSDVRALQEDYKDLYAKFESCQQSHLDCERRIIAAEATHSRELMAMEGKIAGLERKIRWDGSTERRQPEEGT